jgi:hypothetical protein
VRLFVYGTLKTGYGANRMLDEQTFVGEATTKPDYRLYDLGPYPVLKEAPGEGKVIHGEVYEVSDALPQSPRPIRGRASLVQAWKSCLEDGTDAWPISSRTGYGVCRNACAGAAKPSTGPRTRSSSDRVRRIDDRNMTNSQKRVIAHERAIRAIPENAVRRDRLISYLTMDLEYRDHPTFEDRREVDLLFREPMDFDLAAAQDAWNRIFAEGESLVSLKPLTLGGNQEQTFFLRYNYARKQLRFICDYLDGDVLRMLSQQEMRMVVKWGK